MRLGDSSAVSSNTLPASQTRSTPHTHISTALPPLTPIPQTVSSPPLPPLTSLNQMSGTPQDQATGTPSPCLPSEAGPSCGSTSVRAQDPYPQRSPSAASRMSQMSYKKTMFLAKARAQGRSLFQHRALPAHPKDPLSLDPPHTIHAPLPQLPLTASPNREWSSRLEETPQLEDISHTIRSPSVLLGLNPRAQMEIPRTVPLPEQPCLSPITLQMTLSPTPRSPALPQPTTRMSPVPSQVSSPQYAPGASPTESLEMPHLPLPTQIPTLDLDEAIWCYLTSLLEDPIWLLTIAGWDYMYFTKEIKISVNYILREEVAVHAASLWNQLHWDQQTKVPPGYQPIQADSPKPLPSNPDVPPPHADVLDYPLKPRTHGGGPVRSHPMGGQYARGADPDGDRGGHANFVPPNPTDPNLRSLP
ncbi:hypothetical protein EV421DRAFT_1914074 [Armillaria borealis]|uniref:Uncharacterized protein n=1 Tax=Armillaria borealis TaxID=47425 RepID=A0AA39IU72_9AGAR|nr:hypothetical protein EV421DRAFT_1914074 [Armillaria borealis]